jgi:hypothetical protein
LLLLLLLLLRLLLLLCCLVLIASTIIKHAAIIIITLLLLLLLLSLLLHLQRYLLPHLQRYLLPHFQHVGVHLLLLLLNAGWLRLLLTRRQTSCSCSRNQHECWRVRQVPRGCGRVLQHCCERHAPHCFNGPHVQVGDSRHSREHMLLQLLLL